LLRSGKGERRTRAGCKEEIKKLGVLRAFAVKKFSSMVKSSAYAF
jgi:hypothetical protein